MKKMYDYHKAPPNAGHQVPSHDDWLPIPYI
jgi:hypothetical protein